MTHEMPLVIFTLIAQMSVGSFVVLGLIHLLGAKVEPDVMDRVADPALYAIGPLLVLGLAASTFHLGSPLRAANALRHLGTSWLSAEIVAGIVFLALGAVFAAAQWFKVGSPRLRQLLAGLAALVGLALVFCISKVYSLRTVPAWNTPYTTVSFYLTALLLGSLAVGLALVVAARFRRGEQAEAGRALVLTSLRGIALGAMALLAIKLVATVIYVGWLGNHDDPAADRSLQILTGEFGNASIIQYVLIVAGVAVLGWFLAKLTHGRAPLDHSVLVTVAVLAFGLVFAGELVGRMLFYASMVRTGL